MEDISIVEIPPQQVVGIKKTGGYTLIPKLLIPAIIMQEYHNP